LVAVFKVIEVIFFLFIEVELVSKRHIVSPAVVLADAKTASQAYATLVPRVTRVSMRAETQRMYAVSITFVSEPAVPHVIVLAVA